MTKRKNNAVALDTSPRFPSFGRSNARNQFANSGVERIPLPGLSILKDSLLEALTELTYSKQNTNYREDLA